MIELATLGEAREVQQSDDGRKVIAIEAGAPCRVYFEGDGLPAHMVVQPSIADELEAAVDEWIERTARDVGYGSSFVPATVALASYVNSSEDLWKRQAQVFLAWRDAVWKRCIAIQLEVLAGARAVPTAHELIAALPQPVIPTT